MTKWEIAIALWGAGWVDRLWPQIREISMSELIDALPRYVAGTRSDGSTYPIDSTASRRSALLSQLCAQL